jgi:hypothetical protein
MLVDVDEALVWRSWLSSTTCSVLVSWLFHRFSIVFAERIRTADVFFEVLVIAVLKIR